MACTFSIFGAGFFSLQLRHEKDLLRHEPGCLRRGSAMQRGVAARGCSVRAAPEDLPAAASPGAYLACLAPPSVLGWFLCRTCAWLPKLSDYYHDHRGDSGWRSSAVLCPSPVSRI